MPFFENHVQRICGILLVSSLVMGGVSNASAQAIGPERSWAPMSSAAKVAYDDFSWSLVKYRGAAFPFSAFLADVRNYEMILKEDDDNFVVEFHPRPFAGDRIHGGGAIYRIRKFDLAIVENIRTK